MHIARIYEIIILKLRFVFKFFIENFIIFKWQNYWIWIKFRPEKFLSLSRKSLQRAEQRLNEIWTDQAKDWVSINQRSWEFESFQSKVSLFNFNVVGSGVCHSEIVLEHPLSQNHFEEHHPYHSTTKWKKVHWIYILYSLNVILRLLLWDWIFFVLAFST